MASSGHDVIMVGSFLSATCASKWHCQVSLVVSPVVYKTLYFVSRSCYKQDLKAEARKAKANSETTNSIWKRKHKIPKVRKRKQTRKHKTSRGAGNGSINSLTASTSLIAEPSQKIPKS